MIFLKISEMIRILILNLAQILRLTLELELINFNFAI